MAITHSELIASRRGATGVDRSTEMELIYMLSGTALFTEAVTYTLALTAATLVDPVNGFTLYRDQLYWDPQGRAADGTIQFEMRVLYVDPLRQDEQRKIDVGEYKISFDTTGGTAKFLTSKATIATFVAAGDSAANYDFKQCINVSGGDTQGIDVVVPAMKFSISYRQPKATITNAYAMALEALTGSVNNATFFARAAGEVLFLGATGSQGTASDPQIDYHFLRSRNTSGQTIGDIVNVAKLGHEVLWAVFADVPNAAWTPRNPKAIKIERVYDLADFSGLGIGTS